MRRDELEAFKSRINEEMSVVIDEGVLDGPKKLLGDISNISRSGYNNAKQIIGQALTRKADKAKEFANGVKDKVSELKDKASVAAANASAQLKQQIYDLKHRAQEAGNRISKKVGDTASNVAKVTAQNVRNALDNSKNTYNTYNNLRNANRENPSLKQEKENLTNRINAKQEGRVYDDDSYDYSYNDKDKLEKVNNRIEQNQELAKNNPRLNKVAQTHNKIEDNTKELANKLKDGFERGKETAKGVIQGTAGKINNVINPTQPQGQEEGSGTPPQTETKTSLGQRFGDGLKNLKDNFKSKDPKQLKLDFKAAEKAEKEQQKQADEEAKKAREVKVANDGQTKLDLGGLEGKTKTIDPEKKPLMDKVKDGLKNVTDKFKKPEAEEQQSEENNNSFGADGIHKETGTKFDLNGYDANGYNQYGFNKSNFNKDGINKFTGTKFDLNGYDANGFNANGFNKDGFDANGFNKEGYDANGFNKEGYNANGFNKDDIHKETGTKFDKEGYDAKGFNKEGYDIDGYDEEGRNNYGFDRNGFDEKGINRETGTEFDKEGFDVNGFNKEGINKETGTEFNTNGFDINGYDANGFNKEGYNTNGFNKEGINIETGTKFDKNGLDINGNPASSSNTSDTDDTASDTSDNSSNVNNGDNQNDNTAQQTKKGLGDKVLDAIGNAAGTFRRGTNYVGKEIPHAVKNAFNKVDDELNKKYNGAFTPQQNQQAAQQPQQQQMSPNPYLAQAQAAMAAMYNPAFPAYAMPYMMGDMNYGNYNPQVTAQTVGQGLQQNQQGTTNPTIPPNTDDTQNKTLTADDVIRIVQDTLKGNLNNKTTSDNKDYAPNAEITTSIRTKLENGESPDSFSEEENKAYEYYNQNGLIKDGKLVSDDDLAQHFTSKGITSGIIANAEKINKNNNVNKGGNKSQGTRPNNVEQTPDSNIEQQGIKQTEETINTGNTEDGTEDEDLSNKVKEFFSKSLEENGIENKTINGVKVDMRTFNALQNAINKDIPLKDIKNENQKSLANAIINHINNRGNNNNQGESSVVVGSKSTTQDSQDNNQETITNKEQNPPANDNNTTTETENTETVINPSEEQSKKADAYVPKAVTVRNFREHIKDENNLNKLIEKVKNGGSLSDSNSKIAAKVLKLTGGKTDKDSIANALRTLENGDDSNYKVKRQDNGSVTFNQGANEFSISEKNVNTFYDIANKIQKAVQDKKIEIDDFGDLSDSKVKSDGEKISKLLKDLSTTISGEGADKDTQANTIAKMIAKGTLHIKEDDLDENGNPKFKMIVDKRPWETQQKQEEQYWNSAEGKKEQRKMYKTTVHPSGKAQGAGTPASGKNNTGYGNGRVHTLAQLGHDLGLQRGPSREEVESLLDMVEQGYIPEEYWEDDERDKKDPKGAFNNDEKAIFKHFLSTGLIKRKYNFKTHKEEFRIDKSKSFRELLGRRYYDLEDNENLSYKPNSGIYTPEALEYLSENNLEPYTSEANEALKGEFKGDSKKVYTKKALKTMEDNKAEAFTEGADDYLQDAEYKDELSSYIPNSGVYTPKALSFLSKKKLEPYTPEANEALKKEFGKNITVTAEDIYTPDALKVLREKNIKTGTPEATKYLKEVYSAAANEKIYTADALKALKEKKLEIDTPEATKYLKEVYKDDEKIYTSDALKALKEKNLKAGTSEANDYLRKVHSISEKVFTPEALTILKEKKLSNPSTPEAMNKVKEALKFKKTYTNVFTKEAINNMRDTGTEAFTNGADDYLQHADYKDGYELNKVAVNDVIKDEAKISALVTNDKKGNRLKAPLESINTLIEMVKDGINFKDAEELKKIAEDEGIIKNEQEAQNLGKAFIALKDSDILEVTTNDKNEKTGFKLSDNRIGKMSEDKDGNYSFEKDYKTFREFHNPDKDEEKSNIRVSKGTGYTELRALPKGVLLRDFDSIMDKISKGKKIPEDDRLQETIKTLKENGVNVYDFQDGYRDFTTGKIVLEPKEADEVNVTNFEFPDGKSRDVLFRAIEKLKNGDIKKLNKSEKKHLAIFREGTKLSNKNIVDGDIHYSDMQKNADNTWRIANYNVKPKEDAKVLDKKEVETKGLGESIMALRLKQKIMNLV